MLIRYDQLLHSLETIEQRIGYRFADRVLLYNAFIHSSYHHEHPEYAQHSNERMEFFGDSILGLIVSEHLYQSCPDQPEGALSHLRSLLVGANACQTYVEKLEIAEFLLVGRGEMLGKSSLCAAANDLFEALIAAIYLDGGYSSAQAFFFRHFTEEVAAIIASPPRHWKIELHELAQRLFNEPPDYRILAEEGPSHQRHYTVGVWVGGECWGEGTGNNKKEAQQDAAKTAMQSYKERK